MAVQLRPILTAGLRKHTQVQITRILGPRNSAHLESPFPRFRPYATSNTLGSAKTSSRKQVTVRNDDGRVHWNDLTAGEKAARTTQQTFNLGVILLGLGMTVGERCKYELSQH